MTLLFVLVYDLRHKIIPWNASLFLIVLAVIYVLFSHASVLDACAGLILASPLLFLSLVSRGRWMGLGDGVLELSLGTFVGLWSGLTGLIFAFWSGALVGILLIVLKKGLTMQSEVPFAPFLIFGTMAAYFFHVDFFSTLAQFL